MRSPPRRAGALRRRRSSAPLKPDGALDALARAEALRRRRSSAPLKRGDRRRHPRPCPRVSPTTKVVGPVEARTRSPSISAIPASLRRRRSSAPLKPQLGDERRNEHVASPTTKVVGPVEARCSCFPCPSRGPSPTTKVVGPVEAPCPEARALGRARALRRRRSSAPLKRAGAWMSPSPSARSPTTKVVGPVEAVRQLRAGSTCWRSLRRRRSSAPLKQLFRAREDVAPRPLRRRRSSAPLKRPRVGQVVEFTTSPLRRRRSSAPLKL